MSPGFFVLQVIFLLFQATMGMSARESRNLTYTAEEPSFIRSMRERLQGGTAHPAARPQKRKDTSENDPVLEWLGEDRRKVSPKETEEENIDSDDEIAHAQVVVLKAGKHLSREEYIAQKSAETAAQKGSTGTKEEPPKFVLPKGRGRRTGLTPAPESKAAAKEVAPVHKEGGTSTSKSSKPKRSRRENSARLSFDPEPEVFFDRTPPHC